MKPVRISLSSLAIAGLIGAGLSAAPIGFDDHFAPEFKSAFAKGKGSGKSGGKGGKGSRGGSSSSSSGGGSGLDLEKNSNGKGKSGDIEAAHDGAGNGHLKANGNGHAAHDDGDSDHDGHGSLSSALGNLNAAHASPNAFANASENSMVGLLAAYAEAVAAGDLDYDTPEEQQERLGEISNKSHDVEGDGLGPVVDAEVVDEVNALLDGKVDIADAEPEDEEAAAN